jgi:hypothetical protein
MFISLNDEKIVLNFNPSPFVRMAGPDNSYYVELREYKKNEECSHLIEGKILNMDNRVSEFKIPIEFYGDFEIIIFRYLDNYGLNKIFNHRFNDYGKLVKFKLDTDNYNECIIWKERVDEYQKVHGCKVVVESIFEDINKSYDTFYQTYGLDYYKTFNIGRYPKISKDWKTVDPRKEGLIWYGNWKTFWSYQHPRNWKDLSSKEIIDDILGL